MAKRTIHVDSYNRSRHGRSEHGGPVSEHTKMVNVNDLEMPVALSTSTAVLNELQALMPPGWTRKDYHLEVGEASEDELILINNITSMYDERAEEIAEQKTFAEPLNTEVQHCLDEGMTILYYRRWAMDDATDAAVLRWVVKQPQIELMIEDSDQGFIFKDKAYYAQYHGEGVDTEDIGSSVSWLKSEATRLGEDEQQPRYHYTPDTAPGPEEESPP